MTILDDAKTALRISGTAFDSEIQDLIDAARRDLVLAGVHLSKASDDSDPLIKRAVITYCKAHFGWANPDAERLQRAYDSLKSHLSLSFEYTTESEG